MGEYVVALMLLVFAVGIGVVVRDALQHAEKGYIGKPPNKESQSKRS